MTIYVGQGSTSESVNNKDVANGYAGLDSGALLKTTELPTTTAGALAANTTRTSTLAVPVLRDFVSVMDAPFGAKGDVKTVADGAMPSGSNVLSSATAQFAIGQRVQVLSAGALIVPGGSAGGASVPGVLSGFVQSVGSGTANLVTTSGGSTPLNASATVNGATVVYGTDDSTSVQTAITAMSTAGGGVLHFPSGFTFQLGDVTPKNNVLLWCYGAKLYHNHALDHALFDTQFGNTATLQSFGVRGGTWLGTLLETANQVIFFVKQSEASCADASFSNAYVTNWSTSVATFGNPIRATANDNTCLNCTVPAAFNLLNFVYRGAPGGTITPGDCTATNNILKNCGAAGINFVFAPPNGTFVTPNAHINVIFTSNTVSVGTLSVPTTAGIGAIEVEYSTAGTNESDSIVIANNNIQEWSSFSSSGVWALIVDINPASNNDPYMLSRVTITGNTVYCNQAGILSNASDATIIGNAVYADKLPLQVSGTGTFTVTANTTITNTAVTLTAGGTGVLNGSPLSGTGINPGTYLLSGGGTNNWTLSQNATATNTGVTITVQSQIKRVNVSGNALRGGITGTASTTPTVALSNIREFTFENNRIEVDSGGTAGTSNNGLQLQNTSWARVLDNTVVNAIASGIRLFSSDNFEIARNTVRNASSGAASGFSGIVIFNIDGKLAKLERNTIIDDRASAQHDFAINIGSNTAPNGAIVSLIGNEMHGYRTGPVNTGVTWKIGKGNITDAYNSDTIVVTATNATWPLPPGVTQMRVTCIGGGCGGGGGGSAGSGAPTATQVGGAGGSAGMFTTQVLAIGSSTATLNISVGAGNGGGSGGIAGTGASGNPGGQGTTGSATQVSGTGVTTVRASGGGRQQISAANSAATVQAIVWGNNGSGGTGTVGPGTGGQATSTLSGAGGDPVGPVGGGGAGGSPASATLGGLGGSAGSINASGANVTANGNAGTPAGTNGADAAANSGAGGGGGGGGSFNSGGTAGAGGNGGSGGSGYVVLEVLA